MCKLGGDRGVVVVSLRTVGFVYRFLKTKLGVPLSFEFGNFVVHMTLTHE